MAGVMSLMQPQGQQGPMPGQAPQQPMPGMMQQQSAPTPGAMVSQLSAMPFEQLAQFYSNPRPQSPPLWAVISAIAEKQKQAKAMQMAQGQQVMAQNQQMQAQPPVAAEVVMSAEQTPGMEEQDTVMAALGGEMQGYAGGGAVAFQSGTSMYGLPYPADTTMYSSQMRPQDDLLTELHRKTYSLEADRINAEQELATIESQLQKYGSRQRQQDPEGFSKLIAARDAAKQRRDTAGQRYKQESSLLVPQDEAERAYRNPRARTAEEAAIFANLYAAPPQGPMMDVPEIPGAPSAVATKPPLAAQPVASPAGALQRRPVAATKPAAPIDQGIGSLASIEDTIKKTVGDATTASQRLQAAQTAAGKTTPEELEARRGIDALLGRSSSMFEEEAKRRQGIAQQRMQEAQSRFERPGYMDMAGIGRLLGGMKGAKTFYQGAVGAGEAAGKYQEDKEAALRAAQEKFDLSGKETFELSRLQNQVQMDQAKLIEARASGDAQRKNNAEIAAATSGMELNKFIEAAQDRAAHRALEGRRITSTENIHAADRASRERIEGMRLQQQAEINGQTKLAGLLNAANTIVSSAFEKMDRDLEKRFGTTIKMYQMMSPADIAKDPRLASGYQEYLKEREAIYKASVEPALAQRDRLASQVMSGSAGNVQRYDAQGNPVK